MIGTLFDSEQELIDSAVSRLTSLGVSAYESVPCLSRCIDLVVWTDDLRLAIEFKLRDWKRALRQASDHRLAVDRAYVCLPFRKVTPEMIEAFTNAQVGLLFLSPDGKQPWPFEEIVPAPLSDVKWSIAEQWLVETLETRRR